MARFSKSLVVAYAPDDVYALISDIARYPQFIKWITALRVSDVREENGAQVCLGEVVVGFKGFTEQFSTNVISTEHDFSVTTDLVRGPFRHLKANWKITPTPDGGCDCALSIDYEFSSILIGLFAAAHQEKAADRIMAAFMAEAERRYSNKRGPAPEMQTVDTAAPLTAAPESAPEFAQERSQHSPSVSPPGQLDQTHTSDE